MCVDGSDCVTLNVWKPAGAKQGDNLPVVIYIHVSVISPGPIRRECVNR